MRRLLLVVLIFCLPAFAATPSVIQGVRMGNLDNVGQPLVAGQTIKVPLPHGTGANNAIIIAFMVQRTGGGLNPGTPTVSDDQSNTYTQVTTCNANGNYVFGYVAPNVAAGTRVISVGGFAQNQVFFTATAVEATNIATSTPKDVAACNPGGSGTTITAGSITPTVSGDYLFHWTYMEADAAPGTVTAGSHANITWGLESVDSIQGSFLQDGVYTATSAINPTITTANNNGWESLVMAFKSAAAGTPDPGGMEIYWAHHFSIEAGFSTSYTAQVPVKGNLLVDMFGGGNNDCLSSTSTTPTNTISSPGCTANATNSFVDAQYIVAPSLTNNQVLWAFTQPSTTSDYTHIIYDIKGANASPFDLEAHSTSNISGTANFNSVSITPTTSAGIICADVMVDFNTINSTTLSGALLENGFMSSNSIGNTPYDENNGWACYPNTSTASKTFGWSVITGLGANIGNISSQALAFKAPAGGVVRRRASVINQ